MRVVSRPWRGAWNTPCWKHHVTMTLQKSAEQGNKGQLRGFLVCGGWRGRTWHGRNGSHCCHAAPQYHWPASRGTWGLKEQGGSWDVQVEAKASWGSANSRRGLRVGRTTWAAGAFTAAFVRSSSPSGRLPSLSCNRWEDNCPSTIIDLRLGGLSEGLPRKKCLVGATLAPFSQTSSEFGSISCYRQSPSREAISSQRAWSRAHLP